MAAEWLITFVTTEMDQSDPFSAYVLTLADSSKLQGTGALVELEEIQQGSALGGTFALSFGVPGAGNSPDARYTISNIAYNVPAYELELRLETLYGINDVSVAVQSLSFGNRYLITFLDPVSDVELLLVDDSNLRGAGAAAIAYEVVKGIGGLEGLFVVNQLPQSSVSGDSMVSDATDAALLESLSVPLSAQSTASEVQAALVSLPFMGDIKVTKRNTSVSAYNADPCCILGRYIYYTSWGCVCRR